MGIFDSLLGNDSADAARAAAADTYAKQTAATKGYKAYGDSLPGQYSEIAGGFDPYVDAGKSALARLLSGFGLSGGDGADFTASYRALPGYQAGLDTGTTAASRALNAGNVGQSGKALKSLYRFGSDYEDQKSGDFMSRLMALVTGGQAATGAQVGTQAAGLGANTGVRTSAYSGEMGSAGTIGQGEVAAETAKQTALTNLLGLGSYLGGSYLGGRKV